MELTIEQKKAYSKEEHKEATKKYLLALGFTASDIAVEDMDTIAIKKHINYLDRKVFPNLSIKENIGAVHAIAGLWGLPIPPGYNIETPEENTERIRYCEYTYVNRKYYTVQLFGGSPCCFGTAIISLL